MNREETEKQKRPELGIARASSQASWRQLASGSSTMLGPTSE